MGRAPRFILDYLCLLCVIWISVQFVVTSSLHGQMMRHVCVSTLLVFFQLAMVGVFVSWLNDVILA